MFKIVNGGFIKREPTYVGLIFGQPGAGKSTVAVSATKPLLIDLDMGAQRIATKDRTGVDVVQCENYNDLVEIINSPELKNYDTIIVDTFGQIIDMMIRDRFNGSLNPKVWGILKSDFMQLTNTLKMTGKSILFLAHESEEKNDDKVIKRPQCQGKAKDELMKVLDFIGYLHNGNNGARILEFGEDESFYAKNTLGFDSKYVLPDVKLGDNDFWKTKIETRIKEYIKEQDEQDEQIRSKMQEINEEIKKAKEPKDFDEIVLLIQKADLTNGAKLKLKHDLVDHGEEINIVYDRTIGAFAKKENDKDADNDNTK